MTLQPATMDVASCCRGLMDLAGTVPVAAVGAANVAVLDRAERLLTPPEPRHVHGLALR